MFFSSVCFLSDFEEYSISCNSLFFFLPLWVSCFHQLLIALSSFVIWAFLIYPLCAFLSPLSSCIWPRNWSQSAILQDVRMHLHLHLHQRGTGKENCWRSFEQECTGALFVEMFLTITYKPAWIYKMWQSLRGGHKHRAWTEKGSSHKKDVNR